MKGPKPPAISLSTEHSQALTAFSRAYSTPQQLAVRARVVLACADGLNNEHVARKLAISINTARKWRARWLRFAAVPLAELSLAERLSDDPRPGTPARITPEQVCQGRWGNDPQIVALACQLPEQSGRPITHWSPRELAAEIVGRGIIASISPRHAARLLKKRSAAAPRARLADGES